MNPKKYDYLRREANAPYRTLRKFIYLIFGASGTLGGLIFFLQILANKGNIGETLPNLGIQLAVVGIMVWLFRLEK
jgi:Low psii accumulation1 / Rep27